jgi:hypothetical protein
MIQALTQNELDSLHDLMQLMLREAESGNWQALDKLNSQRRVLIGQTDERSVSVHEQSLKSAAAKVQTNLSYNSKCDEILQLDAKITDSVLLAKQQLVKENRNMRNQVDAKKGYAQTATMNKSF